VEKGEKMKELIDSEKTILKEVNRILREIEKRKNQLKEEANFWYEYQDRQIELLEWVEGLVKKAFRVIPKEGEVGSRKTQCPSDCREMAGHPHPREKVEE